MIVKANGIDMNYEISGQGQYLTLIHGLGDNLTMWYNQVPAFSKKFRVMSYDVRGFGKTQRPKGNYSVSLFAEDLYELLKVLEIEQTYILGFSMGGQISVEFASQHHDMVNALILANSVVGQHGPPRLQKSIQMMLKLCESGDVATVAEKMTRGAFPPGFSERNPAVFEWYKSIRLQNNPKILAKIMKQVGEAPRPALSQINFPTLIIAGENDFSMSVDAAKAMQRVIPNSQLAIIPTGHASAIEAPDLFNTTVLKFLIACQRKA
jgi:3-oxoadipate enol-lactonase